MRIVVSGTHASGKSTLISDFRIARPGYAVLGDPFDELLGDLLGDADGPSPRLFVAQLRVAGERLRSAGDGDLIAERGPLDFVAYLHAWRDLGRGAIDDEALERFEAQAAEAMRGVDLLVLVRAPGIFVPDDEDPELRAAMQEALFELAADPALTASARVEVLTGSPAERCAALAASAGPPSRSR